MKRILSAVIAVLLTFTVMNRIYASTSFLIAESDTVTQGDKITLKLDLSAISLTEFSMQVSCDQEVTLESISYNLSTVEQNDETVTFDVGSETTFDEVEMTYSINNELKDDTVITFTAVAAGDDQSETSACSVTYKVSDTKENTSDINTGNKKQNFTGNNFSSISNSSGSANYTLNSDVEYSTKEEVKYYGSDNNYLKKLKVKNYSLNTEFKKEGLTYFVNVESDVKKLSITAVSEDDDASINISGNEDFTSGVNKVLISVIAENKNIRNYRIYVIKE